MLKLWNGVLAWWVKLPEPVKKWAKGLEVAVVAALFTAFASAPIANLTTRTGWAEFIGGTVAAAYGAVRLYMMQSPISMVIKQVETSKTVSVGDITQTDTTKETLTQQQAPAVESVVVDTKTTTLPVETSPVPLAVSEPSEETPHEESPDQLAAFVRACTGNK